MTRRFAVVLGWAVILAAYSSVFAAQPALTVKVLYDNFVFDKELKTDWGFACLVTGGDKTILFDTGGKGDLLLANFEKMKLDPAAVDLVVISHNHTDHTGGLLSFLAKNNKVAVYLPAATPEAFVKEIEGRGARAVVVTKPLEICQGICVVGPTGDEIIEQALVLNRDQGLAVVTGCSHPGIVTIARRAKKEWNRDVFMVLGGTHLLQHSDEQLRQIIRDLKELGVQQAGVTHCSGEKTIVKFKEAFGDGFIRMGVGRTLEVR